MAFETGVLTDVNTCPDMKKNNIRKCIHFEHSNGNIGMNKVLSLHCNEPLLKVDDRRVGVMLKERIF